MSFLNDGVVDDRDVELADALAARMHAGRLDKGGMPYIDHPRRVADAFDDPVHKVVALLHDAVEDTPFSVWMAELLFGDVVAEAVGALTFRLEGEDGSYYARVKANPIALAVKLADIDDNSNPERLARLRPRVRESLTLRYAHARQALAG